MACVPMSLHPASFHFAVPASSCRLASEAGPLLLSCKSRSTNSRQWCSASRALNEDWLEPVKYIRNASCTTCNVFVEGQHTFADVEDPAKYEFRDDGKDIELRVPLPKGAECVAASNVAVDIREKSLIVAVQTGDGVKVLLAATCLYGLTKPSETMWFVDEDAIVFSIKKLDSEVKWPALEEEWDSLASGVGVLLKGTSVNVVGENTDINWAVAKEIATGLGYVPLQTTDLVAQVSGKTAPALIAEEGEDAVAEVEAQVLSSLSSNVRCVVATVGGRQGAAANAKLWNHLHTGFTLWLKLSEATDQASAEKEAAKEKQEGVQAYAKADVVVALAQWDNASVRPVAQGALRALKYLLEAQKDLPAKKSLYVRLGARGDWPEVMPAGWNASDP